MHHNPCEHAWVCNTVSFSTSWSYACLVADAGIELLLLLLLLCYARVAEVCTMPSMHLSLTKCFLALFKTFFYLPFNYVGSQSQTLPIIPPFTWCFDWSVLNFPYIRPFMCVKSTNFTKINHSAFFMSRKFWPEIFISKSKRTCLPNRQKNIIPFPCSPLCFFIHYSLSQEIPLLCSHFPMSIHIFFLFWSLFKLIFKINKFY